MTFITAVQSCLQKFLTVSGRASRSEYWWFQLFLVVVAFVAAILIGALPDAISWVVSLALIAIVIPAVTVSVRRMHDLDRSGLWVLISLVPLIGLIVLFIFAVSRGTDGPNRFGDPVVAA